MAVLKGDVNVAEERRAGRSRVVALVDLDCFYAQVEAKRAGLSRDTPLVVQQWGAVIAVSYAAREFGIQRGKDGISDCFKKCPHLKSIHVDCVDESGRILAGKNDAWHRNHCKVTLQLYRRECAKIIGIFQKHCSLVERASIDEAFLDLTKEVDDRLARYDGGSGNNSGIDSELKWEGTVIGMDESSMNEEQPTDECDRRLQVGSMIVSEIRQAVWDDLGYSCSAGVHHNRKFAKLVAGWNKPNGQTILRDCQLDELLQSTPVTLLQGFGGKLGNQLVAQYGVSSFSGLATCIGSLTRLRKDYDYNTSLDIWRWLHGVDLEEVKPVEKCKRIGSSKNLTGVRDKDALMRHLRVIASEIAVRIAEDRRHWNRMPTSLTANSKLKDEWRTKSHCLVMPYLPPLPDNNAEEKKSDDDYNNDPRSESEKKWHRTVVNALMQSVQNSKVFECSKGEEYFNVGLTVAHFVDCQSSNLLCSLKNDGSNQFDHHSHLLNQFASKKKTPTILMNRKRSLSQMLDLTVTKKEKKEDESESEEGWKCAECDCELPSELMDASQSKQQSWINEHRDLHFATKLSLSINACGLISSSSSSTSSSSSKPKKKLRKTHSSSITRFFSKKT